MISTIVNNDTTNLKLDQSSLQDIPFFIRKGKKKAKVKKKRQKRDEKERDCSFSFFFLALRIPFLRQEQRRGSVWNINHTL